jgi:hypothetical protein
LRALGKHQEETQAAKREARAAKEQLIVERKKI